MRNITDLTGRLGNQMFQAAFIYGLHAQGVIPDVFLQSEKYWEPHKDAIRELYGENIGSDDRVAIHIRRGDYVKNAFYVDLFTDGYYERAMVEFSDAKFLVFSDDIPWCKKQKLFKDCDFSEGKTEVEDMNLMASCKGHIVANSSFSWWGAYLSPHGGKVIAPSKWFSDGMGRVGIPESWKRI